MRLRDLLRKRFVNWSRKYKSTWNDVLNNFDPDADGVPGSLWVPDQVPLIPGPHNFPASVGANEFHTMRALDRVTPSRVRVVVLGQDPYPRQPQATGRAFEQGNLDSWNDSVAYGLKHIIQRLAQHRSGNNWYVRGDDAWNDVRDDASALGLPSIKQLYNSWENQGVIFLNFVLTYTLPDHVFTGHAKFWKPVVSRIIRYLATRPARRVVFALWGRKCEEFFYNSSGVVDAAAAGNYRVVSCSHPSARPQGSGRAPFLNGPNQFREINEKLQTLGENAIDW